jgi:hypothetical protein
LIVQHFARILKELHRYAGGFETVVDNTGGTVTENGVERTFLNDTWLKG